MEGNIPKTEVWPLDLKTTNFLIVHRSCFQLYEMYWAWIATWTNIVVYLDEL